MSLTDNEIDAATRHIYHEGRPVSKEYRVGIVRAVEEALKRQQRVLGYQPTTTWRYGEK